jgi:uncharacterized protein with PIN domain
MRSLSRWLISEETEQSFSRCVSCRLPLLEIDAPWLVNKDYFRGECVLEYAVCQRCREKVSAQVPVETKAAVRAFLEAEIDWPQRLAEHLGHGGQELRFGRCIACLRPRGELEGFAISALFDAEGHLVEGTLPLLMCRDCYGRMTLHLCETSRAVWHKFLSDNFEQPYDPDSLGDLGIF